MRYALSLPLQIKGQKENKQLPAKKPVDRKKTEHGFTVKSCRKEGVDYERSRRERAVLPGASDAEALKNTKGPVRVLVTEPHQKMNVEKLAKDRGKKCSSTEIPDGFAVVIE